MAEIFSWYFPQEIEMHSYDNGTSLPSRQGNWSQLQRVSKLITKHIFNSAQTNISRLSSKKLWIQFKFINRETTKLIDLFVLRILFSLF